MPHPEKRLRVERGVAGKQQDDAGENLQIVQIVAGNDLPRHHCDERDEKRKIDDRGDRHADIAGGQDRQPSGHPNRKQHQQWRARHRQPSGPVRYGRQQKAGNDGRDEAIDHLVHVPING